MCLDREKRNELEWKIAFFGGCCCKALAHSMPKGARVAFEFYSVHYMNYLICREQG